jgi:hypothetical protein
MSFLLAGGSGPNLEFPLIVAYDPSVL